MGGEDVIMGCVDNDDNDDMLAWLLAYCKNYIKKSMNQYFSHKKTRNRIHDK